MFGSLQGREIRITGKVTGLSGPRTEMLWPKAQRATAGGRQGRKNRKKKLAIYQRDYGNRQKHQPVLFRFHRLLVKLRRESYAIEQNDGRKRYRDRRH